MADESSSSLSVTNASQESLAIDMTSPYYLYPSDNPGMVLVSCLLDGENYPTWKRAMQNALCAKNKLGFVDGTLPKPTPSSEVLAWVKCNSMVVSWIFNSLAKDLHNSVAYVDSARDMWLDLEDRFSQGNAPRVHQLKRDIAPLQQGQLSVSAYFTKLKGLWDELGTYLTLPKCTCGASKEFVSMHETEKVHNFLMGLNDVFGKIRTHILSMDPLPNVSRAYALVCQEEKQQSLIATRSLNIEGAALAVSSGSFGGKETQLNQQGKDRCSHCNKTGHTIDHCFEIIGYPPNWRPRGKNVRGSQGPRGMFNSNGQQRQRSYTTATKHEDARPFMLAGSSTDLFAHARSQHGTI
ncbi:uncharacterized protein LOC143879726 [Tasmannia lanceolata]|uniref:uncharacterized protein LOC143879726 n=1 Tax=Tasmannia lanceolata TaxID=3420 RepID=UPI0040637406